MSPDDDPYDVEEHQVQAAKDLLDCAIRDYYRVIQPDILVNSWVLVSHKVPGEITDDDDTEVGTLVPTRQPFPTTIGLLTIALDGQRGI